MRGQYQQSLSRENVQTFIPQTDEIACEFVQHVNEHFVKPSSSSTVSPDFLPALMSIYLERKNFHHILNTVYSRLL